MLATRSDAPDSLSSAVESESIPFRGAGGSSAERPLAQRPLLQTLNGHWWQEGPWGDVRGPAVA